MSLATDLEIHKQGLALLDLSTDVQSQIPRAFRASMGQRVAEECVEILLLICRANAARQPGDRAKHLEQLLESLHVAQMLLRTAHSKKLIATRLWAASIELTDSIGKQANGWLKNSRNRMGEGAQAADPAAPAIQAGEHAPAGYGITPSLFGPAAAAPAA